MVTDRLVTDHLAADECDDLHKRTCRGAGGERGLDPRGAAAQRRAAVRRLGKAALDELVQRVDEGLLLASGKLAADVGPGPFLDPLGLRALALARRGHGDDARATIVRRRTSLGEPVALE